MEAWTNPSFRTATAAGVLRPERLAATATLDRIACDSSLDRWVENYWTLRWDLEPGTTYSSQTVPHPACTLSVERGATRPGIGSDPVVVTGVITERFDVKMRDRGWVFAAKFRPGGCAALTGVSACDLTDRVRPLAQVLGASGAGTARQLAALDETMADATCAALLDRVLNELAGRAPRDDGRFDLVKAIVADLLADRSLVRVAQVEERFGVSARTLQRAFEGYVGVSPKWVLVRYRVHNALTDLDAGYDGSLADLAAELGWYDQAHFTRDFVAVTGLSPGRYRDRKD